MYCSLISLKVTPLYFEILKLRFNHFLTNIFSGRKNTQDSQGKMQTVRNEAVTALARRTDDGDYEVIVPFSGKVRMPQKTFEQLYNPLEPQLSQAVLHTENIALKSVYQKYIATSSTCMC